ncbi:hypothetical protein DERP_015316 [Dermatophagoides pteronyssinus]|uniref:Secreted protein n=1 Tax=Dermatophagoides pteronyssinus TaxID=6956 RepID=A0ABQ8J3J5_DERPT|nr:hypothetical protein DERP_013275 [Dermatophagoides pteronyssinus]KAH9425989.1 hypothetical protein DERP_015316 [Dermatophagoides pteronyssinus]
MICIACTVFLNSIASSTPGTGTAPCIKLTNRDELSFLTVLALPNASRIGLACKSCCSSSPECNDTDPLRGFDDAT